MANLNELFSKFTNRAKQVIKIAKQHTEQMYHPQMEPMHVLLGIIKLQQGMGAKLLLEQNIDVNKLQNAIELCYTAKTTISLHTEPVLSNLSKEFFQHAVSFANNILGHNYVTPEHLLLSLLSEPKFIPANVWAALSIDKEGLESSLKRKLQKLPPANASIKINPITNVEMDVNEDDMPGYDIGFKFGPSLSSGKSEKCDRTSTLKTYGQDLVELAAAGKLDPVIGREKELYQMALALSRRKKNNPILVGEPGVGKTAIVEALALQIIKGKVPESLKNKKIIAVDMPSMIAGTKYRGQFEERIKSMVEEAQKHKDNILFIDEMHIIMGAGSAEGAIDAANILKPSLAKGLQCIGATTKKEFRTIEKDAALSRRLVVIDVDPPSIADTFEILNGVKSTLESFYGVSFLPSAIKAAVLLSERYVSDQFFPDKALDALEDAGAAALLSAGRAPDEITKMLSDLDRICKDKEIAIETSKYEIALQLRQEEKLLRASLKEKSLGWQQTKNNNKITIDYEDVAAVISSKTRIPLQQITKEETIRLKNLAAELSEQIVGQEHVIESLCKIIIKGRLGLQDSNRPIASFLLLGTTGVGKTLLAKQLAQLLFGDKESLIRIDMSEFSDKFTSSKIIGAPPGYVGHDQGGEIAEKVRRRPYSVVLLDEIEKAHPDILNILLQILDEGHITDSIGRKTYFKNTIIIMTSNIGAQKALQPEVGFSIENPADQLEPESSPAISQKIMKELKRKFPPELIARIDVISVYNTLNKHHLRYIMQKEVDSLKERIKTTRGHNLIVDPQVLDFLLEQMQDKHMGARPVKKLVEEHVISAIASFIINNGNLCEDSILYVCCVDKKIIAKECSKRKAAILQKKINKICQTVKYKMQSSTKSPSVNQSSV